MSGPADIRPGPRILGPDGKPMAPQRPGRASMLAGVGNAPYDAADLWGSHVVDWNPYLWSPDGELNMYRDRIVSRIRDLVRNDGWAAAAVTRTVDTVIGADFRPISKPDYRALALASGNKAFDHKWADEFGQAVEACWRQWSMDPGRWCDTQRNLTVPQMMRLAFRHKMIDGDALGILDWRPNRVGRGRGRYATTLQLVDPDRLSNPQQLYDQRWIRGGVEVDEDGAAVAYHIRQAHQGDWFNAEKALHWERVLRETSFGRPIVVHDYDHDRAGQHRGGAGILAPVVQRLKMLIKYDGVELDAAIINAIFAAFIQSPFDPEFVADALDQKEFLNQYQQGRTDFHRDRRISLGSAQLTTLYPGEKIDTVAANRPSGNFAEFENAMLRNVAAGTGLAPQQISQNWSDVNYSSYRAAMLEAWKTFARRRVDFATGFGQPIFTAFLEEAMEVDQLPLPTGAPAFIDHRMAYARARWMGPGRGYVDPVKERQGSILGMDAGLSTLEHEVAELGGADWRENMAQRAIEIQMFKDLGIPLPDWAAGVPAQQAMQEPDAQ